MTASPRGSGGDVRAAASVHDRDRQDRRDRPVRARPGRAGGRRPRHRARARRARLVSLFLVNGQFVRRRPIGAAVAVPGVLTSRRPTARRCSCGGRSTRSRSRPRSIASSSPGSRCSTATASSSRSGMASACRRPSRRDARIAACGWRRRRCRPRRCRCTDAPGAGRLRGRGDPRAVHARCAALDMKTLSEASDDELPGAALAAGGRVRGVDRRAGAADRRPGARLAGHEARPRDHLDVARARAARIRAGIASLGGARRRRGVPVRQPRDVAAARAHARRRACAGATTR